MILLDTNVLIYAYDPAQGWKYRQAIDIVEKLEANSQGAVSTQVLNEFYWNATRKITPPLSVDEASRSVRRFARYWTVVPVTAQVTLEGIRGSMEYQIAFWDSLIWASAKLSGVQTILSEDFSHGQNIEGVTILNPFAEDFALETLSV